MSGSLADQRLYALLLLSILLLHDTAFAQERVDCLFASTPQTDSDGLEIAPCRSDDASGLLAREEIATVLDAIGLGQDQVRIVRCSGDRFGTEVLRSGERPRFAVHVPLEVDEYSNLLGPLLHELAHAYQLKSTPDVETLRRSEGGTGMIELGADYLTGFLIRTKLQREDRATFQRSMYLIGDYDRMITDWHGCPAHRIAAFRMGFYEDEFDDIGAAYNRFRNEYGALTERCA